MLSGASLRESLPDFDWFGGCSFNAVRCRHHPLGMDEGPTAKLLTVGACQHRLPGPVPALSVRASYDARVGSGATTPFQHKGNMWICKELARNCYGKTLIIHRIISLIVRVCVCNKSFMYVRKTLFSRLPEWRHIRSWNPHAGMRITGYVFCLSEFRTRYLFSPFCLEQGLSLCSGTGSGSHAPILNLREYPSPRGFYVNHDSSRNRKWVWKDKMSYQATGYGADEVGCSKIQETSIDVDSLSTRAPWDG